MAVTEQNGVWIGQMSPQEAMYNDWANAQMEYDARRRDPREDVWGKPLQADSPEALQDELFGPLQEWAYALSGRGSPSRGYGGYGGYDDQFRFINTGSGGLVRADPRTGNVEEMMKPQRTDQTALEQLKAINRQILAERQKLGNLQFVSDWPNIQNRIDDLMNQQNDLVEGGHKAAPGIPQTGSSSDSLQPKSEPGALKVGSVVRGFRYVGGNPALKTSWEKAQ